MSSEVRSNEATATDTKVHKRRRRSLAVIDTVFNSDSHCQISPSVGCAYCSHRHQHEVEGGRLNAPQMRRSQREKGSSLKYRYVVGGPPLRVAVISANAASANP